MKRTLARLLFILITALLLPGCTGLFFQPMRDWVATPADAGLAYEDLKLTTSDGLTLSAWFLPATAPARGTVLFLHGNAENISTHLAAVHWLPKRGYNVLLFDYRGYGASQGTPTVPGAQIDIDTAMRHLLARQDVDASRIVVLAQSLGGALGLHYVAHSAHREHIRGVVIDSAFSGYRTIAREKLQSSWVTWPLAWPLSYTVTGDYQPIAAAPRIAPIPVLFIVAEGDRVVPPHHGRALYDAAKEPKDLWVLPAPLGHIQALQQPVVRDRLVGWLDARLTR